MLQVVLVFVCCWGFFLPWLTLGFRFFYKKLEKEDFPLEYLLSQWWILPVFVIWMIGNLIGFVTSVISMFVLMFTFFVWINTGV